jgi:hypothetical protein
MLETCSGRHLEFYAKLDAIDVQILKESANRAELVAKTKWITPLEIKKDFYHEAIKRNGKWYILPTKLDLDIPPDQFLSNNTTEFSNMADEKFRPSKPIMTMF